MQVKKKEKIMADEKKFNEEQLKARDAIINSVVSAGAGSGKTTVLAERYLQLVTKYNMEVSEILTLTFTNKATVEMSSRIYSVLKKKCPQKAADFYTARIQTLDSYCNKIAKEGANLFGMSSDYSIDEKLITKKISDLALPFLLEHRDNSVLKEIAATKPFQEIANDLLVSPILSTSTIAYPLDFEKNLENQFDVIIKDWNKLFSEGYKIFYELKNEIENYDGNRKADTFLKIERNVREAIFNEDFELTPDIINSSSTKEIKEITDAFSLASTKLPGSLKNSYFIKEKINSLRDLLPPMKQIVNYIAGVKKIKELIPLYKEFQDKVNDYKRLNSILTYADVQSMARKILLENKEIRQLEKKKYKAIMIDEFQDNNSDQKDLLFMLAEKEEIFTPGIPSVENLCKEKLFFVGDEKQSIYLFRGADVSVFRGLSNDFKDGNLKMNTNYRSSPALIAAFNTLFGGAPYPLEKNAEGENKKLLPSIFIREDSSEPCPLYEAKYSNVKLSPKAQALVEENKENAYSQKITIALYDNKKNAQEIKGFYTEEEAEAEWVALKIKNILSERKDISPSDIAILFRNYTLQPLYEKALLRHEINYSPEKIVNFFGDGPVNDFYAFLKLCIYPNDRLNYAKVLCSPFVNLTNEEALAVLSAKENPEKKEYLAFEEDVNSFLGEDAKNRFEKAKSFYQKIKELSKVQPLAKTISLMWYESGYRFESQWNNQVEMYADLYDKLFELARNADQDVCDLDTFIDTLSTYVSKNIDDFNIPLEKKDGVQLLTIFKSKGLEYKIVFVCACHKKGADEKSTASTFVNKDYGLIVNTNFSNIYNNDKDGNNYFFEKYKNEKEKKESAEIKRICYVALTRAEEELYITAGKYDSQAKLKDQPSSLLDTLTPAINYYYHQGADGSEDDTKYDAPFILEEITPIKKDAALITKRPNTLEEKNKVKNYLNDFYSKFSQEEIIKKEILKSKYILPSQLHEKDDEDKKSLAETKNIFNESAPYQKINKIVNESISKKSSGSNENEKASFDFNNFGTIAHAYLEASVNKMPVVIPNKDILALEDSEEKIQIVKNACQKMTEDFAASTWGKAALESKWKKTEYDFRLSLDKKIVKGSIDLVYQNADGTYTIVDYKTNQQIAPQLYYKQLAAYSMALSQMKKIDRSKIKCILFYLRFAKGVDISDECQKINSLPEMLEEPEEP